eukprot:6486764-Amphidinium_carterae.1
MDVDQLKGKGKYGKYGKGKGKGSKGQKGEKGKGKGDGKSKDKKGAKGTDSQIVCWTCGGHGHRQSACPSKKKGVHALEGEADSGTGGASGSGETAYDVHALEASSGQGEWIMMMTVDENTWDDGAFNCLSVSSSPFILIDSGSEIHACPLDYGQEYPLEPSKLLLVKSAGRHVLRHHGKRTIPLNVGPKVWSTSFEVTDLKRPILSVKRLIEDGHEVIFGKESQIITKGTRCTCDLAEAHTRWR